MTKNTQPAILTVSYSIFKVLQKEFNFDFKSFKFFAGHSLGEYSALVCSEALDFSDAIYLLYERGNAMQDAVPVGEGSMIAVLGAKIEQIKSILDLHKGQYNFKWRQNICSICPKNFKREENKVHPSKSQRSISLLIDEASS